VLYEVDALATPWVNGLSGYPPLDEFFSLITKIGVLLLVMTVALSWWVRDTVGPNGTPPSVPVFPFCWAWYSISSFC